MIFTCKSLNIWIRINSLIRSKFANFLRRHRNIWPIYVPICIFIIVKSYTHFATNSSHNIVSTILSTQDQLLLRTGLFFLFILCQFSALKIWWIFFINFISAFFIIWTVICCFLVLILMKSVFKINFIFFTFSANR